MFSRRRLLSTDANRFLRCGPPESGSPGRRSVVYFVASTRRSRSSPTNSPKMRSELPPVYVLAVSMKLPPRSTYRSNSLRASSRSAPQPHSVPNVAAPSASGETRSPERPSSR